MLSVVPYDAIVILAPNHLKLKVMLKAVVSAPVHGVKMRISSSVLVLLTALPKQKKKLVPSRICLSYQ